MREVGGDVGEWVVGVNYAPIVQRRAVVVERVISLEGGGKEIEPLAVATVEILDVLSIALRK